MRRLNDEMIWLAAGGSIALAAAVLTGFLRRYALRAALLDRPNARSSHSTPTPRGGGLAIVAVSAAATGLLTWLHVAGLPLCLALLGGGIAVSVVGFLDDRSGQPVLLRLVVHLAASCWAVFWLGGFPPLQVGDRTMTFGAAGDVFGVLGITWCINLFNFMDGTDGIAASEAIFVAWAGALLGVSAGVSGEAPVTCAFGAACLGFLLWNWPPAKIFMGDVGSGYLGYTTAVLALAAARQNSVALWVWLILGGVFIVDATVTLVRRLIRRERLYEAHRSHAYQWLARRWGHRPVTLGVCLLNVTWLLPCAAFATFHPAFAGMTTALAFAPLLALALMAGSGRKEISESAHSKI